MGKYITAALACAVLALSCQAASSLAAAAPSKSREARALVMERCTLCHGTQEICENLGQKGKDGWDRTVSLMMLKGAPVGAEQKALIVDWLWNLPAGSSPLCPGKK